jgi:hypothetical protein
MDMLLIEIILWGGLLFLFWAMKDGLGKVETDIEPWALSKDSPNRMPLSFAIPDAVSEVIGSYQDAAIYRYITIQRQRYVFDHIQLAAEKNFLPENKRCVAPGLIYVQCSTSV